MEIFKYQTGLSLKGTERRGIVRSWRLYMTILQACILGIFQGIAEFLPISSSGHLVLLRGIMGLSDVPAMFDIVLHLATLASILVIFRKRIRGILRSIMLWIRRKSDEADAENLSIVIPGMVATAITAALGLLIESIDLSPYPKIVAGLLLVTALILIASSRIKPSGLGFRGMKTGHGVIVGLAQGLGVLPGISRSGITISAGLASGLGRETAGEFSFLLAIPAILGALLLKIGDLPSLLGTVAPLPLLAGALLAFAVGIGSLLVLMPIVKQGKLAWFAVYLIPAGLLGLFLL